MLHPKPCHVGLRPRSRFLGLEPIDLLLLFPGFYVFSVVFKHLLLAMVISVLTGVALRALKWGRLPGYSLTLIQYLISSKRYETLGHDSAPTYRA